MAEDTRNLVVTVTHGIDHELSSVALTLACGALTAGMKVALFLTSSGVDLVRRRAADTTHVEPLEPLAEMLRDFMRRGGKVWACPPCTTSRGYDQVALLEGVEIVGGSKVHELLKGGAATLSF
jgi:predicted peroxiredoxin